MGFFMQLYKVHEVVRCNSVKRNADGCIKSERVHKVVRCNSVKRNAGRCMKPKRVHEVVRCNLVISRKT